MQVKLDTGKIYWHFTAIDVFTRIRHANLYSSASAKNATYFSPMLYFLRLFYHGSSLSDIFSLTVYYLLNLYKGLYKRQNKCYIVF